MKAFLLAAGLGTRLKPLTDTTPKCLVPVQGKPLLDWWAELLLKHGIDDICINTHHLSEKVVDFILRSEYNICWNVQHEEVLLGSAGTLRKNKPFVRGESEFLVAYADVFTNCDISLMAQTHRSEHSIFTMAVAPVDDPQNRGILEVKDKKIISFEEKPEKPKGNLANMGVYMCGQEIFDYIPPSGYADIATDVIPKIIDKTLAYQYKNDYFCDTGTVESLNKANNEFQRI